MENTWGFFPLDSVEIRITARGAQVRQPQVDLADHIIRVGFVCMGFHLDAGDGTVRTYWRTPYWIDFDNVVYDLPTNQYYNNAIRWYLTPGTEGHIWVWNQL